MGLVVVGIGDCKVSGDLDAALVTYALGSCVAVLAHDPLLRVGGLLHYMLPEAALNQERASTNPSVFGDTGIALLIEAMKKKGSDPRRLRLLAAGGAQVMDDKGTFNIGKRNQLMLKKALWKAGLAIHSEQTGGTQARTVRLEVASGRAFVRADGGPEVEWVMGRPAAARGGAM